MKAVKLCMLMMAALPVMAVASPAANPDAPALTPEAFDAVVASLPEPNPLGGFAVHSKQFCGSCHGPNGIAPTATDRTAFLRLPRGRMSPDSPSRSPPRRFWIIATDVARAANAPN